MATSITTTNFIVYLILVSYFACFNGALASDFSPGVASDVAVDSASSQPSSSSSRNSIGNNKRLMVVIAVDQLRPDRLVADLPGGLGRLVREGYVYREARLNHAVTNTCPGHLSISTGVNPAKTGIPGNSFFDRGKWKVSYCVEDDDPGHGVFGRSPGTYRSPHSIRAPAIGDWMKSSMAPARVYAVAGKDRSAIALGGQQPDGVFWYDKESGKFTSSAYYMDELPGWINRMNAASAFKDGYAADFPATWTHGPGTARPDKFKGESTVHLNYSGHPLNKGSEESRAMQVYESPYLDVATSRLVRKLMREENLGQTASRDLLLVSFSSIDTVGHLYGPYSAESADTLSRLDRLIGELLDELDRAIGPDRYMVALSADHGVLPLPEWLALQKQSACSVEGGRLDIGKAYVGAYWHIASNFTKLMALPQSLMLITGTQIAINHDKARSLGYSPVDVIASMEQYFESQEGIKAAWTVEEINSGHDSVAQLLRNSFVPDRSGDLYIQTEETCLIYWSVGTTHESPYDYDRRVPLVFFGTPWASGESDEPVFSTDLAPTMADGFGIPVPGDIDGRILVIPKK